MDAAPIGRQTILAVSVRSPVNSADEVLEVPVFTARISTVIVLVGKPVAIAEMTAPLGCA